MKILKATILLFLCFASLFVSAQDPAVKERMQAIGDEFDRLPIETRTEYGRLKKKVYEAWRKQKYFTCMIAINDALSIFPNDLEVIFLKGGCRAQIHDVDATIVHYNEVLRINPNYVPTLMQLAEINFYAGRYEKTIEHIVYLSKLVKKRGGVKSLPLLEFKYLICATKLAKEDSAEYGTEIKRLSSLYGYMEDSPYYYYVNALKEFEAGNKQEGLVWILKACAIFESPALIETWNKALVDTGFIGAYEIMFSQSGGEKEER